jgi:Zn-dependent M16 (insulinase) family peptidase
VAHILEHTALCGSEKYPIRDPFFNMLRRSLSTFMNAMVRLGLTVCTQCTRYTNVTPVDPQL